jgi:hypothetical protein
MSRRRDPDADLFVDDDDADLEALEQEARNPHASATRWRHEESRRYARHAAHHPVRNPAPTAAREPENRGHTGDLASFLNESRVSPTATRDHGEKALGSGSGQDPSTPRYRPLMAGPDSGGAIGDEPEAAIEAETPFADGKQIAVGPLLNYRRTEGKTWVGSVLVVTKGGGKEQPFVPTLTLRREDAAGKKDTAIAGNGVSGVNGSSGASADNNGANRSPNDAQGETVKGLCLYSDARNTFWRFTLKIDLEDKPVVWEYSLPDMRFISKTKPQRNRFHLPAQSESMRILFHSCNGFSVGTDEEAFSGPALWNDVLRKHADLPFNVMIGGGDQIYNDGIRVNGPLRQWTDISNPKKRKEYPFPEQLRQSCDNYYLRNYLRWYGTEPFATANGQIPQLNIWDDHDIIDGFGSYVDEFMKCAVFRGIGGTAHKYYMLFQHHMPPPPETFTTDAAQAGKVAEGQGFDPKQRESAYVHPQLTESNYIVGPKPGVCDYTRQKCLVIHMLIPRSTALGC